MENCYSIDNIVIAQGLGTIINKGVYAGGIVGSMNTNSQHNSTSTATIKKCFSNSTVTARRFAGGIIGGTGEAYDTVIYVAKNAQFTISECANWGDVTATEDYAGGIAGLIYGTDSSQGDYKCQITNCYNLGTIKATENLGTYIGQGYAQGAVGAVAAGIATRVHDEEGSSDKTVSITNCFNLGIVDSEHPASQVTVYAITTPGSQMDGQYDDYEDPYRLAYSGFTDDIPYPAAGNAIYKDYNQFLTIPAGYSNTIWKTTEGFLSLKNLVETQLEAAKPKAIFKRAYSEYGNPFPQSEFGIWPGADYSKAVTAAGTNIYYASGKNYDKQYFSKNAQGGFEQLIPSNHRFLTADAEIYIKYKVPVTLKGKGNNTAEIKKWQGIDINLTELQNAPNIQLTGYAVSGIQGQTLPLTIYQPATYSVTYTPIAYNVTFKGTDGTTTLKTAQFNYNYNLRASDFPAVTPQQGYVIKWYNAATGGTEITAGYTITGVLTLYAREVAGQANYTVNHYLQNVEDAPGTNPSDIANYTLDDASVEVKQGTTGQTTVAVAKTFTGFTAQTITQQTIKSDGTTTVNVFYNREVYTVSARNYYYENNANNANVTEFQKRYGSTLTAEEIATARAADLVPPTYDEHYFINWYKVVGESPDKTVDFFAEGGVTVTESITLGENAATPAITGLEVATPPSKLTYYVGESIDATGQTGFETVTGFTVKTIYTPVPTSAEGTISDVYVSYVQGFSTASAGTFTMTVPGSALGSGAIEAFSVTQQYTVILREHTLTFDANGGAFEGGHNTSTYTAQSGEQIDSPIPGPTKAGYEFDGWFADAAFTNEVTFPHTVTADITVYAKWVLGEADIQLDPAAPAGDAYTFNYNGGAHTVTANVTEHTGITYTYKWFKKAGTVYQEITELAGLMKAIACTNVGDSGEFRLTVKAAAGGEETTAIEEFSITVLPMVLSVSVKEGLGNTLFEKVYDALSKNNGIFGTTLTFADLFDVTYVEGYPATAPRAEIGGFETKWGRLAGGNVAANANAGTNKAVSITMKLMYGEVDNNLNFAFALNPTTNEPSYATQIIFSSAKITPAAPTVSGVLTGAITYPAQLSESTISAQTATGVNGETLEGSWAWTDGTVRPTATDVGHTYEAVFTPTSTNYSAYKTELTVFVDKLTVNVTISDSYVEWDNHIPQLGFETPVLPEYGDTNIGTLTLKSDTYYKGANIGEYFITVETGYENPNYDFTYTQNALLKVYGTVTYDKGGVYVTTGVWPTDSDDYFAGTTLTPASTGFGRAGYTLASWKCGETIYPLDTAITFGGETGVKTSLVLTAVWTAKTYSVTLNANGGTIGGQATKSVEVTFDAAYDFSPSTLNLVAPESKFFGGWTKDSTAFNQSGTWSVDEENVTLTAVWQDFQTYEITFLAGGAEGTPPTMSPAREGETITLPAATDLRKIGYSFAGWRSGGTLYSAGGSYTMTAADVTFTAEWQPNTDTAYVVKHYQQNIGDDNYTIVSADTQNLTGTTGNQTAAAAKSYTGFNAKPFEQAVIAADGGTVIEIYYDRAVYAVSFLNGSETVSTAQLKFGAAIVKPQTDPVKISDNTYTYEFSGWQGFTENMTADKNIDFAAQYTATYIDYTITFKERDGVTVIGTQTKHYGDTLTAPAAPEITGFRFTGWSPALTAVSGDTVYTAVYVRVFTVTVANGTVNGESSATVDENGNVTVIAAAAPEGKRFSGWSDGNTIVSTEESYTFTATENITLTAVYEDIPEAPAPPPAPAPAEKPDKLSGGAIAGIVIGVLALLGGIAAAVVLIRRKKRK